MGCALRGEGAPGRMNPNMDMEDPAAQAVMAEINFQVIRLCMASLVTYAATGHNPDLQRPH